MKIRLLLSYQGTGFFGWQRQKQKRTVQGEIEKALQALFQAPIAVTGSGRTDTGVHAIGQNAHFELPAKISEKKLSRLSLVKALNHLTPPDISLLKAWKAPPEFHARLSAEKKTYIYLVFFSETPPALFRENVFWQKAPAGAKAPPLEEKGIRQQKGGRNGEGAPPKEKGQKKKIHGREQRKGANRAKKTPAEPAPPSDPLETLNKMAKILVGTMDFKSFQSSGSNVRSAIRTIYSSEWRKAAPGLFCCEVTGSGFLKQMVRNLVGSQIGLLGHRSPERAFLNILSSCDRKKALAPAPAGGLYLKDVFYPPELERRCQII